MYSAIDNIHFHFLYIDRYSFGKNWIFPETSTRFTTSVFFEGGDLLEEYYHLPKIMEGKGEFLYFDEMYNWVKKESPAKMFFVRGYLELLIASLIAKVNQSKSVGEFYLQNNTNMKPNEASISSASRKPVSPSEGETSFQGLALPIPILNRRKN